MGAAAEAKRELVEVVVEVFVAYGALVGLKDDHNLGNKEPRVALLRRPIPSEVVMRRIPKHVLKEVVRKHDPELQSLVECLGVIPLSAVERERLRDAVAAELCETGLDEEGAHNARGIVLDDLIDALGHL